MGKVYNVRRYRRGRKGGQAGTCICVLIPLRFDPVNPEAMTVKQNLGLETQLICQQIQVELHGQKDENSTESPSRKDAFRTGFPRFSRERGREWCDVKESSVGARGERARELYPGNGTFFMRHSPDGRTDGRTD